MFEQRTRNVLHKHISECQWSLARHVAKKNRELITEPFHNGDLPIHMTLKLHGPESFLLFLLQWYDLYMYILDVIIECWFISWMFPPPLCYYVWIRMYGSSPRVVNIKDKDGKSLLVLAEETGASRKVIGDINRRMKLLSRKENGKRSSVFDDASFAIRNLFADDDGKIRRTIRAARSSITMRGKM